MSENRFLRVFQEISEDVEVISTGNYSADKILAGGFWCGEVTEIVVSDEGASTSCGNELVLCSICHAVVMLPTARVLIIRQPGSFTASNFVKILIKYLEDAHMKLFTMRSILSRIECIDVMNWSDLAIQLQQCPRPKSELNALKLVFIPDIWKIILPLGKVSEYFVRLTSTKLQLFAHKAKAAVITTCQGCRAEGLLNDMLLTPIIGKLWLTSASCRMEVKDLGQIMEGGKRVARLSISHSKRVGLGSSCIIVTNCPGINTLHEA